MKIEHPRLDFEPKTLVELLQIRAERHPEKRAYSFFLDGDKKEVQISYAELEQKARAIASLLQKKRLQGERALLLYPPGLDYIVGFLGCLYAGAIAVPAYPPNPKRLEQTLPPLETIVKDSQAKVALTTSNILSSIKLLGKGSQILGSLSKVPFLKRAVNKTGATNVPKESFQSLAALNWIATDNLEIELAEDWKQPTIDSETIAFLQYTSGSTGMPKGVMVCHRNLLHNLAAIAEGMDISSRSEGVIWLPIYHDMGLIGGVLQPLYLGFPCNLMSPLAFLQWPIRWLNLISRVKDREVISGGPNFAYNLLIRKVKPEHKETLDLSNWRVAFSGAEPVRAETINRFSEAFASCGFRKEAFYPCYGLAEATLIVSGIPVNEVPQVAHVDKSALENNEVKIVDENSDNSLALVSCGTSIPGQKVVIANPETRQICRPGEIGEVWVKGPSVTLGYWNKPEQTEETFHAYLADERDGPYLRTGDLGFMHQGQIYITGRLKDLIIIRGRNYYPQDIEYTVENSHESLRPGCGAAFSVEVNGEEKLVVVQEVRHPKKFDAEDVFRAIRQAVVEAHDLQIYSIVLIKPRTIFKTSSGKIKRSATKQAFLKNGLKEVARWQLDRAPKKEAAEPLQPAERVELSGETGDQREAVIQKWLITQIATVLNMAPDEIDIRQPLSSYGLDSVEAVNLTGSLEAWLDVSLSPTLVWDYPTIEQLARYLATESSEKITPLQPERETATGDEPIAIVGMECRFPGAKNVREFWELLRNGVDAIGEIPENRWDIREIYDPNPGVPGKAITRWGGFIDGVDLFDAQFFGISPREAERMDPQQRLLLEVVWEALENAGIAPSQLSGSRTGVFVGISNNDYSQFQYGNLEDIDAYTGTGNAFSIAANRISYILDLRGPSIALDTACSSSLVAVHLACQSLRAGESNLAIVGGVNIILTPELTVTFSQARMMSPTGRCRTFDAAADGYVRGEGCGVVVLKRLSDAVKDGDNILAVIRGTAVNQDGRSNGITAPNRFAQQEVIRRALRNARVAPRQIGYVEAHGTGTILGDPIEVQALSEVFSDRPVEKPIYLGSVKTNIGHLEAAAGIAGLIKVALALKNNLIPPHLHFQKANPYIPFEKLPFEVPTEPQPWPDYSEVCFAGISSFGFGGTNAHVILSEAPPKEKQTNEIDRQLHLLCLSAKDEPALHHLAERYVDFLKANSHLEPADLCFSANTGRMHFEHRLAIIASKIDGFRESLQNFSRGEEDFTWQYGRVVSTERKKVAFLFTGQGAQYPGMGRVLYDTQPTFRKTIDRCNKILEPILPKSLTEILFGAESALVHETAFTQPALFALEYALAKLWMSWGILPDYLIGHSIGEYVAACIAGVFSLEDGLKLVATRGALMQSLPRNGEMVAVLAPQEEVETLIQKFKDVVSIAGVNGPKNTVISGKREAIEKILLALQREGIEFRKLKVSHAFHSPLMEPILDEFEQFAAGIEFKKPGIPIVSNVTGRLFEDDQVPDAHYWRTHIREGVQFYAGMQALAEAGCTVFVETGPNPTLMGMGRRILSNPEFIWVPSLKKEQNDWQILLESVKTLYTAGFNINWKGFDQDYHRSKIELPTYPFRRERFWYEPSEQKGDGKIVAAGRKRVHPILGYRVDSPLKWRIFENQLSRDSLSCFADYRFQETAIFPVGAFLEMAYVAAKQLLPEGILSLQEIVLQKPMLWSGDGSGKAVQLLLSESEANPPVFEIYSRGEKGRSGDPDWQLHVSGSVLEGSKAGGSVEFDVANFGKAENFTGELPLSTLSAIFEKSGFVYGESYRGYRDVRFGQGVAQGEFELPSESVADCAGLNVHPAYFEAGFQMLRLASLAELGEEQVQKYVIPKTIGRVTIFSNPEGPVLIHAAVKGTDNGKEGLESLSGDIWFTDKSGKVLMELKDVNIQSMDDEMENLIRSHQKKVSGRKEKGVTRKKEKEDFTVEGLFKESPEKRYQLILAYMKQLFAKVLRIPVDRIELDRSITDFGFDSIVAVDLAAKVEAELGVHIDIKQLMMGPTIAQMARHMAEELEKFVTREPVKEAKPKPKQEVSDHPLSHGQKALWIVQKLTPETAANNLVEAARIPMELDVEVLRRSFQKLIDRHAALRTTFPSVNGEPVQRVFQHREIDFTVVDASGWSTEELEERIGEEVYRPFDLENGPLIRVIVYSRSAYDHVVVLAMHHIITDLWSYTILLHELGIIYEAEKKGVEPRLKPLPLEYTDYVEWQNEMLAGPEGEKLWSYWKKQLSGELPVLNLPTDLPRPPIQSARGAVETIRLRKDLVQKVREFSEQHDVSLFSIMLTAFFALLHRYSGQEDILVGTPRAGRDQRTARIIGYFVNPVVMRADLSGNPSFNEFLQRVRQVVHQGFQHGDFPFDLLVERLQPTRDLSRTPIFQVMFAWQKTSRMLEAKNLSSFALGEAGQKMGLGKMVIESVRIKDRISPLDLTLLMAEAGEDIIASLEYSLDLFKRETILRMLGHFQKLLEGMITAPQRPIGSLPILTEEEQRQILFTWNQTVPADRAGNERCIHQLFEQQVEKTPDAVAVFHDDARLTYDELNRRANRLAHYLIKQGVGPEVRVGICVERSPDMMVGIMGILKAGGAYVPLDPAYPKDRLSFMMEDAGVTILLTQRHLHHLLPEKDLLQIVFMDSDWAEVAQESSRAPRSPVLPDNTAYVIFTSGSTGKPKGVLVSHRNLVHSTRARFLYYQEPLSGYLLLSSYAFDSSIAGIFWTICAGGTLYLPQQDSERDVVYLSRLIAENRISHLLGLPSLYGLLLKFAEPGQLDSLRVAIVAGEACPVDLIEHHFQKLPQTNLYNEYGPTEGTVWCSVYRVPKDFQGVSVPIGKTIANMQLYILDAHLQPVPIGVPGELLIGGAGITRGYLNRPDQTAERFIPHPFSDLPGERLYRTGDLVRYLPDGNIEFLGRIDHQVKIRGYRIELEEIETVIKQHPGVQDSVVLVREDQPGEKRLVGYVILKEGLQLGVGELRSFLKEKLPEYMVPAVFMVLEEFPLMPNGKVDRNALPAPDQNRPELESEFVAPRNAVEQKLAEIWAEVLNVERVGIYDNFFELGGDSILGIQVIARANQAGLRLTPRQLFENQMIADLAKVVGAGRAIQAEQGVVEGPVPLTPIQHWFFEQELPEPHHWNQALLLEVHEKLDPEILKQVLEYLITHHDALRLRFKRTESGWEQVNTGLPKEIPFEVIDLSRVGKSKQTLELERQAAELQASLDIVGGPLLRVVYFVMGDKQPDRLLFVVHHLAIDGISWRIILEDMQHIYQQLLKGETVQLPPKTTSFRQWAQRLVEYAQSEEVRKELDFWEEVGKQKMSPLALDHPEGENTEESADVIMVSLTSEETQALLHEVPPVYRTEINDVLLTALVRAFQRYTGEGSLLIDLEGHGREDLFEDIDISRTVGWFTTVFPVHLNLNGIDHPGEQLKAVKEQLRRIPNRGFGYGLLRYLNRNPEVTSRLRSLSQPQVSFNYLGQFDQSLSEGAIFKLAPESCGPMHSLKGKRSYLIEIDGGISEEKLWFQWTYSRNLHKKSTIEKIAQDFIASLRELIAHCQSPDAGGYTASDFADFGWDENKLSKILEKINKNQ